MPTIDISQLDNSIAGTNVIEYVGSLSTSTLTQADKVTVGFRAYPWVGDETAVMDSNDSNITGSVTTGTFLPGEQVKQGTTNTLAYLDNIPSGAGNMVIGQIISQASAADNSHVWTGQSSGATYTPTTVPVLINNQPSPLPAPQYYLNDKSGTYGTADAAVDPSQNITGSVAAGTFTSGEKVTQSTSGAVAYLIGTVTGSNPMVIGATVSGTPDSSHTWTGGASGATYTPSAAPTANGSDSNSCAVATSSYNYPTTPSAACATVSGALAKMEAFNNTNYSHATAEGTAHLVTSAGGTGLERRHRLATRQPTLGPILSTLPA